MNFSSTKVLADLPASPVYKCPYLGVQYDALTYSANQDIPNFCHKTRPIAPVSIEHQVTACAFSNYETCPVYLTGKRIRLPSEYLNQNVAVYGPALSRWFWILGLLSICLITMTVLAYIFRGTLFGLPPQANVPIWTDTTTLTPTPTKTRTHTPTHMPKATQTLTPQLIVTETQQAILQTIMTQDQAILATQAAQTLEIAQTQTGVAYVNGCETDWANRLTAEISAPVFSPGQSSPPESVVYGSIPFLVRWNVKNTSPDCLWSTVQLQTGASGLKRTLTLMDPNRSLPVVNKGFAIKDQNNQLINQVEPGRMVTLLIQIDGLELYDTAGKIDKTYNLVINGHVLISGMLVARSEQWVVVKLPTETPKPGLSSNPGSQNNTPTVGIP